MVAQFVEAALATYRDPNQWSQLVANGMKQDFSWQATAEAYMKAYRRVTRRVKAQPVDD